MLHPIKPSCKKALSWATGLQKDILFALCDPAISRDHVTIEWASEIQPVFTVWIKRFLGRKYRKKKIIDHMKTIASQSDHDKQLILDHFTENLNFANAFNAAAVQPTLKKISDCPASDAVLALLEAFYELALREIKFPVDSNGTNGGTFDRNDFIRLHGQKNSPRVCPLCDGEMDGAQVEHWLGKAKFPSLSCHPCNLLPACYRCNSVEKGTKLPLDLDADEPFADWFHPYERQAVSRFHIMIKPPKVEIEAKNPAEASRVKNLDKLLGLKERWSLEYVNQKQDFLRQLRTRFRRKILSELQFMAEVELLGEVSLEDKGKKPHALLQTAIMERVVNCEEEFSAWYADVHVAIEL